MNAHTRAIRFRPPTAAFLEDLERHGYVVIRGAVQPALIAQISEASLPIFARTPRCRGAFYGSNTRQFRALLSKLPQSTELVMHGLVLDIISQFLTECDRIQLNSTQAIEVLPKARQQPPHRDQQVWHESDHMMSAFDCSVNVMWPFTRYERGNGTTMIWPGTHKNLSVRPTDALAVHVELDPGDVLLFSGRVLHCQGANTSSDIRRGLIVSYALGWLRTLENMFLTYPRWFDAASSRAPSGERRTTIRARGAVMATSNNAEGDDPGNAAVAVARRIRQVRLDRFTFFSPELLGEPVWDLLLQLFIAGEEGRSVSIHQLGATSGVAASTTLRWLRMMIDENYLECTPLIDDADSQLMLTRATKDRLTMFLAAVEQVDLPTA